MKFPEWLTVLGDVSYRGNCPSEDAEQITFFNELKRRWPDTLGKVAFHPHNEGNATSSEDAYRLVFKKKVMGMATGASDIIIPGINCVIELKRRDHTKSKWQKGQEEYLKICKALGASVYVSLGWEPAIKMLEDKYEKYNNTFIDSINSLL